MDILGVRGNARELERALGRHGSCGTSEREGVSSAERGWLLVEQCGQEASSP